MTLKCEKKKIKAFDEKKVKLNLNKLYQYHIIVGDNTVFDQVKKVVEEFQELMSEIKLKIIGENKEKYIPNFENFQNEVLDLITVTVNLIKKHMKNT